MDPEGPTPPGDLWVFAYGSLMWRPDFTVDAMAPARVHGWHRAFCMTSIHYRGTPERPGLVLGLAPGGACVGRLLRVAKARRRATIAALRERELISYVYREVACEARRLDTGERVRALAYVADRTSPQYVADHDLDAQARRIAAAAGRAGTNAAYLRQTVTELDALGITATRLHRLLARVEALGPHPHLE